MYAFLLYNSATVEFTAHFFQQNSPCDPTLASAYSKQTRSLAKADMRRLTLPVLFPQTPLCRSPHQPSCAWGCLLVCRRGWACLPCPSPLPCCGSWAQRWTELLGRNRDAVCYFAITQLMTSVIFLSFLSFSATSIFSNDDRLLSQTDCWNCAMAWLAFSSSVQETKQASRKQNRSHMRMPTDYAC